MILSEDIRAHRHWFLNLIEQPEFGTFADLGCGNGSDLLTLASRLYHPKNRFIGLDLSDTRISEVTTICKDHRVEFRQANLENHLPLDSREFDAVYSNNLLECLDNPIDFIQEIGRILKPNGQLVIAHWDWDSQVFYGSNKSLIRYLVHAFADWKQVWMKQADGWMGRRLWGLFNQTRLFEGNIHARVLTNTIYAKPWYGYERAQDFQALIKAGLATTEQVSLFIKEQEKLAETGQYFYSITSYVFVGRLRTI